MKNVSKIGIAGLLLMLALWLGNTLPAYSQTQKRVIQLSGVIFGEDSLALPGVNVYVPKAGRGTTTNLVGFFSMPVLVGDSIVFSSIGYERRHYIVPATANEYTTIIVPLVHDVTYLEEVKITPFPTEEVFKEAVLALNVPLESESIDKKNLNAELLALMLKTTPMDGPQNGRYYLNQWSSTQNAKFQPVTNPFLNPFNWVKFFNSLKKDKKK